MTKLSDYQHKYPCMKFDRTDGVLEVTLHSEGKSFIFNEAAHNAFGFAFADVADDHANKVVILTGAGQNFCAEFDYGSFIDAMDGGLQEYWARTRRDGRRMLMEFLNIEVPVIAAINGPALSHSELPLLSDVVLASDTAQFQDATHFVAGGLPPGDGMHVVWTTLLGLNRGRHFLLTGRKLDAHEALEYGVVGEVLPKDDLLDRARSLAHQWAEYPRGALLGTRAALTIEWKRLLNEQLHQGLTLEAIGHMDMPMFEKGGNPIVNLQV